MEHSSRKPKVKKSAHLALALYLVKGNVISVMNAFKLFGVTNASRELSRGVEKKYGVILERTPIHFKSRYGQSGVYFQYRLPKTPHNKKGIAQILKDAQEAKMK